MTKALLGKLIFVQSALCMCGQALAPSMLSKAMLDGSGIIKSGVLRLDLETSQDVTATALSHQSSVNQKGAQNFRL